MQSLGYSCFHFYGVTSLVLYLMTTSLTDGSCINSCYLVMEALLGGHSFNQQILIQNLLCIINCSWNWELRDEEWVENTQGRSSLLPHMLVRKDNQPVNRATKYFQVVKQ